MAKSKPVPEVSDEVTRALTAFEEAVGSYALAADHEGSDPGPRRKAEALVRRRRLALLRAVADEVHTAKTATATECLGRKE